MVDDLFFREGKKSNGFSRPDTSMGTKGVVLDNKLYGCPLRKNINSDNSGRFPNKVAKNYLEYSTK